MNCYVVLGFAFYKQMMYLDPSSGSFLLQLLAAALLGGGFAIKMYWKKIKALFTGKKEDPSAPAIAPSEDDHASQ